MSSILLLIPPLTQLNTPYPSTAYLKGFLDQKGIPCQQGDLGLDMVLEIFSEKGILSLFDAIEAGSFQVPRPLMNILANRMAYETTISAVISFLQNKNYTIAYRVATRNYLPEGPRFDQIEDLEWFFGNNGIQDKARYLCTLYLEDLADLVVATVGPHFGFSKYAERIARTAVSFDPIQEALQAPTNYLDAILELMTAQYFEKKVPLLVGFTVPFPGNLYGALKSGQWIKKHYPGTKVVLGGGYANTELRELKDPRVFDYVDFVSLDNGEMPLLNLYEALSKGQVPMSLQRTFYREYGKVIFLDNHHHGDIAHSQTATPSYDGLRIKEYLSMIDMPNPMHRLWSDGRWNKLTIAHGCYWKKCSFCDISLDYIGRFEQTSAKNLVDKMEQLIAQTGETGFHFVDEAAPPLALRDLALEIIRRKLQVSWWTNIRFEKTFTEDLCHLLAASGCIAVTGGLEVASDRLLMLMEKGVTIEQVARVCKGFREAGILVHAYLMYGFPTETAQETIDSLEVVRQLFENNLLQSGFWHQFAMTVHSPVGINPSHYLVERVGPVFQGFANNDLFHEDPTGADHELFSAGLKKALYNYMYQVGFDFPLQDFFEFKIPKPNLPKQLIANYLKKGQTDNPSSAVLMWHQVGVRLGKKLQQGREVYFHSLSKGTTKFVFPELIAEWMMRNASHLEASSGSFIDLRETLRHFSEVLGLTEEVILKQDWWKRWREIVWVIKK